MKKPSRRPAAHRTFITPDFLLESPVARRLYHTYAADLPILDYHNHLPPQDIATDRRFENLTQIWLAGDHYKWRAMRTHGVAEHFITGPASDREKFQHWAATVPATLRNPLYHWTHLELQRPFGIQTLLNEGTADAIWKTCTQKLARPRTMDQPACACGPPSGPIPRLPSSSRRPGIAGWIAWATQPASPCAIGPPCWTPCGVVATFSTPTAADWPITAWSRCMPNPARPNRPTACSSARATEKP
jgi:hypothetical protein